MSARIYLILCTPQSWSFFADHYCRINQSSYGIHRITICVYEFLQVDIVCVVRTLWCNCRLRPGMTKSRDAQEQDDPIYPRRKHLRRRTYRQLSARPARPRLLYTMIIMLPSTDTVTPARRQTQSKRGHGSI